MKKEALKITGMTCAACASAVERSVSKLDVESASVNLAAETLSVTYDEEKINIDDIKRAVERAGYGVRKDLEETVIPIAGMTCAACARAVENSLRKLAGVKEANVNYASEKAKVSYVGGKVSIKDLKEAIRKAGYEPLSAEKEDVEAERKKRERMIMLIKLIAAAVFTIPLFYIAMGHMLGFPLPDFGSEHQSLQFRAHATHSCCSGHRRGLPFLHKRFSKLFRGKPNMDSLIAIGTGAAFLYGIYASCGSFRVAMPRPQSLF